MKKTFRIGLLVFAIMCCLGISALAASSVNETALSAQSWSYTATFDGSTVNQYAVKEGEMYLLIAIKGTSLNNGAFPSALTADAILYIDQTTATASNAASNTIVFTGFIPMNYAGGNVYITGGTLTVPTLLGTMQNHGILGDTDGDNSVTVIDARYILQKLAGSRSFDSTQTLLADTDSDGNVTIIDARYVLQYLAGSRDKDFKPVT